VPASASTVMPESGDWQALKSDNSCSIGSGSEAAFTLLYFVQQHAFALDLTSPVPWNFSDGAVRAIRVATDDRLALSKDNGFIESHVIQFILSREDATVLLKRMSAGARLQLEFPNDNVHGGFIRLEGSQAAISAFSLCLAANHAEPYAPSTVQASSMPYFLWSASSIAAGNAMKDETIQLNRLSGYISTSGDTALGWLLMTYIAAVNSRTEPLSSCIERNCDDLPASDISAFRASDLAFDSIMTANGIPPSQLK
jgi:hypothetical protein